MAEQLSQEKIEENARRCALEFEVLGCYAIRREEEGQIKFYCFMADDKPECAGENFARFDRTYCSALTNGKPEIVKDELHYECSIRNELAKEGKYVNYDSTQMTAREKAEEQLFATKVITDTKPIAEQIVKMKKEAALIKQRIRENAKQIEQIIADKIERLELLAMGDRRN